MPPSRSFINVPPVSQRTSSAASLDELKQYMHRAARNVTASLQAGKSDREALLEATLADVVAKRLQKQDAALHHGPDNA
jgi:hypothetical protein